MKMIVWGIFIAGLAVSCDGGGVDYIAHRGASFLAPENTHVSIDSAWSLGADAVEIDIQIAKDNQIVVIHDKNTLRTSGRDYIVSETLKDSLLNLEVGKYKGEQFEGEKIPLLQDVLLKIPKNRYLVVELKSKGEIISHLKEVVDKSGKVDQLVFICFDWHTILSTKNIFPKNKCYWLCGNKKTFYKRLEDPDITKLDGVNLKSSVIDLDVVQQLEKNKLNIITYTVDDPEEAKRLIKLGVKKITTNRPAWLKRQVCLN